MDSTEAVFRVERGQVTDRELAAVTAVLCSLLAGRSENDDPEPTPEAPLWQPERAAAAYRSPYHWR
jgi:hypothetical protein